MNDKMKEQLEFIEKMRTGFGIVRTEEQIQDDLDKEFEERMKREEELRKQEEEYQERLRKEKEEQRQRNYESHKDIFDFIRAFNELPQDDYYAVIELKDGSQHFAKPQEMKRDEDYLMIYIMRNKGTESIFENPYVTILETNVNEIKGLKLENELKKEVILIKKSVFGVMTE